MEMIPDATALKIHFKFVLNVCLYHFLKLNGGVI